mmetsp:Transcript_20134/g.29438  ORF Transcript_20134/g.29438 Transcript_20134/m.29438 type:complete len:310 (+) Transcript_20134:15-944(+)
MQFQNLMNDIGKVAEQCLEAAAQHGEVIIITNSDDGWVHYSAERYVPNLVPILDKYRIVSARTAYEHFYPGQPLCWKAAAFAHEVNETFEKLATMMDVDEDEEGLTFDMNDSSDAFPRPALESLTSTDESSDDSEASNSNKANMSPQQPRVARPRRKNGHGGHLQADSPLRREVISFGDSMEERTAVKIVSNQLKALPKSVMFISSPTPEQLVGQLTMLTAHMKYVCEHLSTLDLEISPHQAEKCAAAILGRDTQSNANDHAAHSGTMGSENVNELQSNRPLSNFMPRMRRAVSSERQNGVDVDETFSL